MTTVDVSVPVLKWAQHRSGRPDTAMSEKFKAWHQWLNEEKKPTFAQVEAIARYTHVPVGYFFLSEPPVEELPIPDFRVGRGEQAAFSDDLLETLYLNQRRQAWYEDYISELSGVQPLPFVGSAKDSSVTEAAVLITNTLGYGVAKRKGLGSATAARSYLMARFEELGGLVVINSMVKNDTHRMLSIEEFRGFTLHSNIAPLVFVNGSDTQNGQVFSLLHEFAHVWRGESGISAGGDPLLERVNTVEQWCDAVAAEIAVPLSDLQENFNDSGELTPELDRLSERYLCSTLVILLRLRNTGLIPNADFNDLYEAEVKRLKKIIEKNKKKNGGDFYNNQPFRIGETLSRAIIRDTNLGTTSMTEALRLLGFKSVSVFDTYAHRLEEM